MRRVSFNDIRWATVTLWLISLFITAHASAATSDYVIHISVDGLVPSAVTTLGPTQAPNFYRLRKEGAGTDNARSDFNYTLTVANHTSMITGRHAAGAAGHNWTRNTDPLPTDTYHNNKGSYVASIFDVVHDNGLSTAAYLGKTSLSIIGNSYNATSGAPDTTGPDNGRAKIDAFITNSNTATLNATYLAAMTANPYRYSLLHYTDPDAAGHSSTWDITEPPPSPYLNAVRTVDGYLGTILNLVESSPQLKDRTTIILLADHGGILGTNNHINNTHQQSYTIPFYVWGAGVAPGDLYAMNSGVRFDPGTVNPDPASLTPPIRTGDVANLALELLGLGPVPGSTINADQSLSVPEPHSLLLLTIGALLAAAPRRR
jgi:hypothetical protein